MGAYAPMLYIIFYKKEGIVMVIADEEIWRLVDGIDIIKRNTYSISSEGRIRTILFGAHDPEYISTNGYAYTLMMCINGRLKLFRVDKLIAIVFGLVPEDLIGAPIIVKHLDGDTKNNMLSNLKVEPFYEEWVPLIDDEVDEGLYQISNFGRIKSNITGKILTQHIHFGYKILSILKTPGGDTKSFRVHRLVALHFMELIPGYNDVNHIDGDKTNNMVDNLEWVNQSINQNHAYLTGLERPKSAQSFVDKIDAVRDIIIQYPDNYEKLIYDRYPDMTYTKIRKIRENKHPYNVTNRYDLNEFKEHISRYHVIPPDIQDMIRDMLMDPKYCGNSTMVYNSIDHNKYPMIWNVTDVIKIKSNIIKHYRLSNKYDVDNLKFPKNTKHDCKIKSRISTELIDIVRDELLRPDVNGSPTKAFNNLKDMYPELTIHIVKDIKYGKRLYMRTKKYDLFKLSFDTNDISDNNKTE